MAPLHVATISVQRDITLLLIKSPTSILYLLPSPAVSQVVWRQPHLILVLHEGLCGLEDGQPLCIVLQSIRNINSPNLRRVDIQDLEKKKNNCVDTSFPQNLLNRERINIHHHITPSWHIHSLLSRTSSVNYDLNCYSFYSRDMLWIRSHAYARVT